MADSEEFLDLLDSEGPEVVLSHHPDGGSDEGGEDKDGRKFPGPDGLLHQDRGGPGHGYFHDESDEAGGHTERGDFERKVIGLIE